MNSSRLRQIAILVDSLDVARADKLLDQLPAQIQRQVRDAVIDLDDVDEEERQAIIADFMRKGQPGNASKPHELANTDPQPIAPNMSSSGRWGANAGTYGDPRRAFAAQPHNANVTSEMGGDEFVASNAGADSTEPKTSQRMPTQRSTHWAASENSPGRETLPTHPQRRNAAPASIAFSSAAAARQADNDVADRDVVDSISNADFETLASVVMKESPQVLAVVLSLLPPQKSATLLELFPVSRQQEALRRLSELDDLDDEVLNYLQQQLNLVIRRRVKLKQHQKTGPAALAGILSAAKSMQASGVVASIEQQLFPPGPRSSGNRSSAAAMAADAAGAQDRYPPQDRGSARLPAAGQTPQFSHSELEVAPVSPASLASHEQRMVSSEVDSVDAFLEAPLRFAFADLHRCDRQSLQTLLATAKPKLTLLALRGAAPILLKRVLGLLPRAEAKEVQYRIQNLGPTRLEDIQQAQQYLLRLASVLQDMGQFKSP